ncbi:MAG TPA: toprim domain-containing protein [Kofleriaceae bacterium]|jgi:hypothetical protein
MMASVRVADVRDALRAEDVINTYGLRVRKTGAKYRLNLCPGCGASSSSWAIEINPRRRTWGHFGHGKNEGGTCFGDLIDLVAACEGLSRRSQWPRVLDRAAAIAGVSASITDDERARRARERVDRERRLAAEDARADQERRVRAAVEWRSLDRGNLAGELYLAGRGLDPVPLVGAGHVLFSAVGDVCVRLHDLRDGELVTVHRRRIAPPDPSRKCHTPAGGTTRGTLCGRIQEIVGDTVVTEGVADTLTAIQLWPRTTVIGAAGAGQLRAVAEAAAPIVRARGGRLWIVRHDEDVGVRCAADAAIAARDAGLVVGRDLLLVDIDPHNDLNDAHRAGWRP